MVRLTIALLALAVTSADAFKFMSNWKMPTVLTDEQKVKIAKMEERFGDKSKQVICVIVIYNSCSTSPFLTCIVQHLLLSNHRLPFSLYIQS